MSTEQQLVAIFRQLAAGNQASLLTFAEFLQQRGAAAQAPARKQPKEIPDPLPIERPEEESVIAGLKRLSKTYPMLSKSEMLSATSDLVTQNILQGRDAAEVIDELEEIFRDHFQQLKTGSEE